jgi:hypothetical protein
MVTRWESEFSDAQWLRLDMGVEISFTTVELYWETAHGTSYDIDISDDGETWNTVYKERNGNGGVDVIDLSGNSGRYIRMYGRERSSNYGYSLFDVKVSGDPLTPSSDPIPSPPASPTPLPVS